MLGIGNAWGAEKTYTFTSKSWGDSENAWTSNKDGGQLSSGRGVQVSTGNTGASATSKSEFNNVSRVVVVYSTNASKGAGTINVQIGSNAQKSFTVTSSGGTTDRNAEFSFSPTESGKVKLTINCTTNSIYVKSITIETSESGGEDPGAGGGSANVTYDFTKIDGFSSWPTSYANGKGDVVYTEATVKFTGAVKQTQTITDCPVTKGGQVQLVLNEAYADRDITNITFVCRQWGTKTQTITLHYSTDKGVSYTTTKITSTNFTISSAELPEGTNAVKITFSSSSNQVGIESVTFSLSSGEGSSGSETPEQLAAPTGLTAEDITSNSATLSWNEVANMTKYEVTITDDHDYTETFTVTDETKSVSSLSPNTTYYWTVTAIGNGTSYSNSDPSSQASFNTLAPCTDFVTISKGTPSNGSFKLDKTGEQSTCNGAVTVTLSDIQPAAGYKFSKITQTWVDASKVTIDNTAKTVTYAKNTTGTSTINVTFEQIPRLAKPTNLKVSSVSCANASLTWDAVDGTNKYKLVLTNTSKNTQTTSNLNTNSAFITLSAGVTYSWTIQAIGNGTTNTDSEVVTGENFTTHYTITYNTNGGSDVEDGCGTTLPETLPTTSKNHYTFDGWYLDENFTTQAEASATLTKNTDLYAKWTAKTYTITLDANGGTFVDKRDSQTKGSATFDYIYGTYATYNDAPNLTEYYSDLKRDGYQFDKWVSAGSPWNKLFTSTGDRTIQAQWSKLYTITLYENDTEIKLTPQTSTSYTLPNELSAGSCQDDTKELVGWSTVAIPTPGDMPTSKFYELGETVTLSDDKTTFYAVFATPKTIPGGTEEKEVTTTLNFSAQGYGNGEEVTSLIIDDVTVAFNKGTNSNVPKYYNTGAAVRVYGGGYFTVTVPNESSISTIALTFGSGDESNTITTNSNTYSNGTWTGSAQSVKFTVGGTTGHRRIKSVKVTYTTTVQADDIVTYSKYSTTCEAVTDIELQSIEISGDLTKKTYIVGDVLDLSGLSVIAKYSDGTSQNVTTEVEWSDVTLTVGQTSVTLTATYEGKKDDITITGLNVSSPATPEPEGEWVLTSLADITCSDLVVITMKNSNATYALTNVKGTSDAPKATEVEIANDKLKTEPSEILQWVVMNNNGGLTIYPVNDYNSWLYCKDDNDGVRVGDNENAVFTIDATSGYLYHLNTARYLGVYNNSEWRCYTTVNNNIKEQTLAFFVKKDANPNPCEKPVDDGINPVATFIFNTAEGLEKLGITDVESSLNISEGREFIQEGVTMTNVTNGSTSTRVWALSSGNYDLRMYKKAKFKLSVPQGHNIRKVVFEGDNIKYLTADNGEFDQKVWTGKQQEVVFTIADDAATVKIYTISVAVDYTRDVTPGEYGTICIPYGSNNYTGAEFYEVSWLKEGLGLYLDELAANAGLVAGKPYIFLATSDEIEIICTGEAVINPVDGKAGLTGTFTKIQDLQTSDPSNTLEGNYMIADNKIWLCGTSCWLNANRAYIKDSKLPKTEQAKIPGRRRVCMGENTTTDFENITNGENNTIKVIENGQLFIIRNGEKYNIQGQKL